MQYLFHSHGCLSFQSYCQQPGQTHCYYSIVVAVAKVADNFDAVVFTEVMTIFTSRQFEPSQRDVAYCSQSVSIAMLFPLPQSSSSTMLVPLRFVNSFLRLFPFGFDFTNFTSTATGLHVRKLRNLAYLTPLTLTFEFLRLQWPIRMLGFVCFLLAECVLLKRQHCGNLDYLRMTLLVLSRSSLTSHWRLPWPQPMVQLANLRLVTYCFQDLHSL